MQLRHENTRAKVTEVTEAELEWLDKYLTFEDTSRIFMRRKFGKGDPYLRLLDKRNNTFPSGLVRMAGAAAREEGFSFSVIDARKPVCTGWDSDADVDWLYDFQFDCVWECQTIGTGICQLPTGAGKTEIMAGLVLGLPCHWLFVVHRKDLMHNAAERWTKRTGRGCGLIGDGHFEPDPERRLTCCTFKTLADGIKKKDPRVLKLLGDVEGLLVDECHTVAAQSFWKVAMATRRAFYRLGFSGTPLERGDKRSVFAVAALGPIIYEVTEQFLIDKGVLARPIIRTITHTAESQAKTWQGAYSDIIVKNGSRNSLVIDIAHIATKPALLFVKEVEHGKQITNWLNKSGIRAEFQWGEKDTPSRKLAIKRLRYGELDVVVCSVIFQEGIDVPELEAGINAAGMKSTIAALQKLGRGMRSNQGKKLTVEYWDIFDRGNKFMERHAKHRVRAYKKRGHAVTIVPEGGLCGVNQAAAV